MLTVNGVQKNEYGTIDGVEFTTAEGGRRLIKCTVYYVKENGERKEIDFLFSCRSAAVDPPTGGGESD